MNFPTKNNFEILICSAWLPEQRVLKHVCEDGNGRVGVDWAQEEIGCAAALQPFIQDEFARISFRFLICGMGAFKAQETLLMHLAGLEKKPDLVCFVGTAGLVGNCAEEFKQPFSVTVNKVRWLDFALLQGHAYAPPGLDKSYVVESPVSFYLNGTSGRETVPEFLQERNLVCASTAGITLRAPHGYDSQADLENLELFGVARACEHFKLPWLGYLGVSNSIGQNAHEQWRQHHIHASCLAQRLCIDSLLQLNLLPSSQLFPSHS